MLNVPSSPGSPSIRVCGGFPPRSPPGCFYCAWFDITKLPHYVTHCGSPRSCSAQPLPSGSEKLAKLA